MGCATRAISIMVFRNALWDRRGRRLSDGCVGVAATVLERRLVKGPGQIPFTNVLETVLPRRQDDGQESRPQAGQAEEGNGEGV